MTKKASSMARVTVPLKNNRDYDIIIGSGAVSQMSTWLKKQPSKSAFVIADERLVQAREKLVDALKAAGWSVYESTVHAGESLKDIETVYPLYGKLLQAKASRDSVLFALGGGSVGDAAGFVAATYLRGIEWVGVPTTLLAQVDSSVGGKTGINHVSGKNLVGAFHQPSLVVCDTDFLKTLSPREIVSGLGETIKYGLIFDPKFLQIIKKKVSAYLDLDPKVLKTAIQTALNWKAKVVAKDEFDRTGIREVLNFGHTFGHALEAATRYGYFQHGEAVILGMRFALALSQVRKVMTSKMRLELDGFLKSLPVPEIPKNFGAKELFTHMQKDKKIRDGKIHFVLLKKAGETVSDNLVTEANLYEAYQLLNLGGTK